MKRQILLGALALVAATGMARAEIDAQALANSYVDQGYTHVEVTVGPNDVKVEAVQGGTAVEVVYDRASGAILSQEQGRARGDESSQAGIEIRTTESESQAGHESADDGSHASGHGDDDSADDDHGGRGDDDGADDDHGGHGNDDGADDDHGGRGNDDGAGDDHGGHGSDD